MPQLGWSSWNHFGPNINENLTLGIADAKYRVGGKAVDDGGGVAAGGLAEPIPEPLNSPTPLTPYPPTPTPFNPAVIPEPFSHFSMTNFASAKSSRNRAKRNSINSAPTAG